MCSKIFIILATKLRQSDDLSIGEQIITKRLFFKDSGNLQNQVKVDKWNKKKEGTSLYQTQYNYVKCQYYLSRN